MSAFIVSSVHMEQVKGTDFYINSLDSNGLHLDLNDTDTLIQQICQNMQIHIKLHDQKVKGCLEFSVRVATRGDGDDKGTIT